MANIWTWQDRTEKSRGTKADFLKLLHYDILCLQEMRLKIHADINELNKVWNPGHSIISIGEDSSDGVGIFFKKDTVNIIKRRDIIPGQLLLVDCCYYGQKLHIINVYNAPDRTKKMQLLKKMKYLLEIGFNIFYVEILILPLKQLTGYPMLRLENLEKVNCWFKFVRKQHLVICTESCIPIPYITLGSTH